MPRTTMNSPKTTFEDLSAEYAPSRQEISDSVLWLMRFGTCLLRR